MSSIGQRQYGDKTGFPLRVSADGNPEYKHGGVTFDWTDANTSVNGTSAGIELSDGTIVPPGKKYHRYGTFITRTATRESQTITITGTPTGGTFTLALTRLGRTRTTAPLAHNATAAAVQAALEALDNLAPGEVAVSGGPGPGTPYVATFNLAENLAQLVGAHAFTGGTTPNIGVTTTVQGVPAWGLFRRAVAADNALPRGDTFVLNETVVESDHMSDHAGGPFYGGAVFYQRLRIQDVTGDATDPTYANAFAGCPRLQPVRDM